MPRRSKTKQHKAWAFLVWPASAQVPLCPFLLAALEKSVRQAMGFRTSAIDSDVECAAMPWHNAASTRRKQAWVCSMQDDFANLPGRVQLFAWLG